MSTSALQKQAKAAQLHCARHCELPLSKMGSKGLFPVVAVPPAFFGTFFRFERKYYPPRGNSLTVRAGVGASPRGRRCTPAGAPKGFPLALWKPSGTESRQPIKQQVPIRASCGASIPRRGFSDGRLISSRHKQGAFRSPPAPLRIIAAATNSFRQKMTSVATPKDFPQNKPFQSTLPLCTFLFVPHNPKWPRQKRGQ